jgi:hypothetical protein
MAALKITEIVRQVVKEQDLPSTELTDTYRPVAEMTFEAITRETVTITSDSSGNVAWDVAIAYLIITLYYSIHKEGHMVTVGEGTIPAHVWWEQTAFRYLVNIGYNEMFTFNRGDSSYIIKEQSPMASAIVRIADQSGGYSYD